MSPVRRLAGAVACLAGLAGGSVMHPHAMAEAKRSKATAGQSGSAAAQQIIALTNRERASHGLAPLKIDRRCVQAIGGHVSDMARGGFLSHEGSDGRGPDARFKRYSPKSLGAGENVAYNAEGTGASFMRQWMNSSGHRNNILNPRYKGIGAAVRANCSRAEERGKCYYYAGQCFSL